MVAGGTRLLGLDPGLRATGWGVIEVFGDRLAHVASGTVKSAPERPLAERLAAIHHGLAAAIADQRPDRAAIEETFVSKNAVSTLKLGQARGAILLTAALAGLEVSEYPANTVKKSVVGVGHASKDQVRAMVRMLLPGCGVTEMDAADALAVAICHAHHVATLGRWAAAQASPAPAATGAHGR